MVSNRPIVTLEKKWVNQSERLERNSERAGDSSALSLASQAAATHRLSST